MVSWDGELVASVFIGVAYENHFLRVIFRPQVLNPVHPAITAARSQAQHVGAAFHRQALRLAALDTAAALRGALGSPAGARRTPDMDTGQAAVSLREIYSSRFMDDMLQYDDARRYIMMMQRRAFSAVYSFLDSHNVDTTAFRAQTNVILNTGVMNTGEMSNVQNQPGATGSGQKQGGS
jgi:hypothetical protein